MHVFSKAVKYVDCTCEVRVFRDPAVLEKFCLVQKRVMLLSKLFFKKELKIT